LREQGSSEGLQQLAAEAILESSSLTDELTDEEARPLISWGLVQARLAVESVVAEQEAHVNSRAAILPADDLRAVLAERLAPVRRIVKASSALTIDRHRLSVQEVVEELVSIRAMAGKLPAACLPITGPTLAELAAWQLCFDNATFIRAMLVLLHPEPILPETEN
jgi:hypothetical protein